jgi:hypothetical protein
MARRNVRLKKLCEASAGRYADGAGSAFLPSSTQRFDRPIPHLCNLDDQCRERLGGDCQKPQPNWKRRVSARFSARPCCRLTQMIRSDFPANADLDSCMKTVRSQSANWQGNGRNGVSWPTDKERDKSLSVDQAVSSLHNERLWNVSSMRQLRQS